MSKRIQITPEIAAGIKRVSGDIDLKAIGVWETRTVNNMPLRKKAGLYAGGIVDISVMEEMVSFLNASNEGVPMHVQHNTGLLNVGKAFMARLDTRSDGYSEVSTLFYVPLAEEGLVARLDTSVVDQVSVGLLAKKVECSGCGFDWRQASLKNYVDMKCSKGHTPGKDGIHTISKGLESWAELSLVDIGAANDARIVTADQSRFTNRDNIYKLAASNQNHPETIVPLIANLNEMFSEESTDMDEAQVKALIAAALSANTPPDNTAAIAAAVAPKDAEIASLNEKITALEANQKDPKDVEKIQALEASVATLTEANGKMMGFLKEQANVAQIAANVASPKEAGTFDEAITIIKESGVMIAKLFARQETDKINKQEDKAGIPSLRAFKARD